MSIIYEDKNQLAAHTMHAELGGKASPGHSYLVVGAKVKTNIDFQLGPVTEHGVNGLTSEVLLAILIDRAEELNKSFPCAENSGAIAYMTAALQCFNDRTADRVDRGVEGKPQL